MDITKTNVPAKQMINLPQECPDEVEERIPLALVDLPTPTVSQLEEILEERVLPDRRQKNVLPAGVVDRRVSNRRSTDT